MKSILLIGAEETRAFAAHLASSLPRKAVLALYGTLGSGKTTFVQGLVRGLQGNEQEVHSPTFLYLHLYSAAVPIFHFDLYRMRSEEEFLAMGFPEYFEQEGIAIIEWAEKIKNLLPPSTITLQFSYRNDLKSPNFEQYAEQVPPAQKQGASKNTLTQSKIDSSGCFKIHPENHRVIHYGSL